jgi:hypothetical protein
MEYVPHLGKFRTRFIDPGLTVYVSPNRAVKYLSMLTAMATGDADEVARIIASMADMMPSGNRRKLQSEMAQELKTRLFNGQVNVTDMKYNLELLEWVLKKNNAVFSKEDTIFFKSLGAQTASIYQELAKNFGGNPQANFFRDSGADIAAGLGGVTRLQPRDMGGFFSRAARRLAGKDTRKTTMITAFQYANAAKLDPE